MEIQECVIWYLAIINVIDIAVYGWDKLCAIKRWWRGPELTLLGIAVIGGSVGALVGMKLFHHKTLHIKFKYGVPVILMFQLAGFIWLHTLGN